MQPYPYGAYQDPYGARMPVRYMAPANYRQTGMPPTVPANQHGPQSLRYPPPGLPPPPMSMMMPIRPPPQFQQQQQQFQQQPQQFQQQPQQFQQQPQQFQQQPQQFQQQPQQFQQQPQQFQYPQGYYYNSNGYNGVNPAVPSDSKAAKNASKKGAKENKDDPASIAPNNTQNQVIKSLVANSNVNQLLQQKGTKVKVSKIYRITKTQPDVQDHDSSDDEFEQVTLDSARPRTLQHPRVQSKQPRVQSKQPTAQIQRGLSAASSCSHYSTCSNCSCSECRNKNGGHPYNDHPQHHPGWEHQQGQIRRQHK